MKTFGLSSLNLTLHYMRQNEVNTHNVSWLNLKSGSTIYPLSVFSPLPYPHPSFLPSLPLLCPHSFSPSLESHLPPPIPFLWPFITCSALCSFTLIKGQWKKKAKPWMAFDVLGQVRLRPSQSKNGKGRKGSELEGG